MVLGILIGTASAAFIMQPTQKTALRTQDIYLSAGPDSTTDPTSYPAATVVVAPTLDSTSITFSLFPSAPSTPQPATHYTNLLHVTNVGTTNRTIDNITISDIMNASNLGSITVYYFATQTDSPQNSSPIRYRHLGPQHINRDDKPDWRIHIGGRHNELH